MLTMGPVHELPYYDALVLRLVATSSQNALVGVVCNRKQMRRLFAPFRQMVIVTDLDTRPAS